MRQTKENRALGGPGEVGLLLPPLPTSAWSRTSWGAHSRLGSRPAGLWPGVGQAVLLWLWGPCKCGCECVRAFVYAHAGLGRRGRAGEGRAFAVGLDPCPGGCSRSRAVHLTPELEAKGQN